MPRIVEAFVEPSGNRIEDPPGTISGTNDADFLWGTESDDIISGKDGNDRLKGGGGADELWGGAGIDTVYYGDSAVGVAVNLATGRGYGGSAEGDQLISIEYVFGSFHNDTITGNDGNNDLYGLNGNDVLKGGGGADGLAGDDGDDILKGGGGADYLEGGVGSDTADYSTAAPYNGTIGVIVDLLTNQAFYGDADGDTFNGIENVTGSAYFDILAGDDGANVLRGVGGNDWLRGHGGNDTLVGGVGGDILEGGTGVDTADYSSAPAWFGNSGIFVDLLTNRGYFSDAQHDTFNGIENIRGSAYFDDLRGDDGANVIDGGGGDDMLEGYGGNDRMIGGLGNDLYYVRDAGDVITEFGGQGIDEVRTDVSWTLTAGADVETLCTSFDPGVAAINLTGNANGNVVRGNAGNNVINGGDGRDELTGLAGQDSYLFDTALSAGFNVDIITDFSVADDTIWLDDDIFSSGLTANNSVASSQFVIGPAALDAGDRIIYNNATGAVLYDSDGTGPTAAVQFARLSAGLPLTHFDFFVVS